MNHAARHLCINSAQYTLANTNRRINNKLDTRTHAQASSTRVMCADQKQGPEMNYKQKTILENSRRNATTRISEHQTDLSGFRV